MFPFLNYEFRIRMNAKYKKWGDWLMQTSVVNMVKYGKMMIDIWKGHRKELNVMADFESYSWVNRLRKLLLEAEK